MSKILNERSVELEDGTVVTLIDVKQVTKKYLNALKQLENSYIQMYDEDYNPVKEIEGSNILAYVYDADGNCINDYANGDNSEVAESSENVQPISVNKSDIESDGRISGKNIDNMSQSSLSEMYEKYKYSVFLIAVPISGNSYAQGTGFFIASEGIGVSNYHVFAEGNASNAIIKTIDNLQYPLKRIIKYDENLDYIVFEVDNNHLDFPHLTLATERVGVGQDVFAIGNPRGLEHTLSKGIISSYRDNDFKIQTTTEITHGSSGGPLFNMQGQVIGITTSGVGEANLNFAMNIQKLSLH